MDAFVATLDYLSTLTDREWFITGVVGAFVMFLMMIDYRT
jgi:hypothetical protein